MTGHEGHGVMPPTAEDDAAPPARADDDLAALLSAYLATQTALGHDEFDGAVAACGLAQGSDLPATVLPFILRDVTLAGVNSVLTSREKREEAWGRLATDLDLAKLNSMTLRARLEDVPSLAAEILVGKTRGRVLIDL